MSTIGATVKTYLPFLNELQYPEDTHTRKTFKRERPTAQVFEVVASDGFKTRLTRHPGSKGPVLLVKFGDKPSRKRFFFCQIFYLFLGTHDTINFLSKIAPWCLGQL